MFFSQQILSKRGPLGIIWIAAHLEGKLKKNQIRDADILMSISAWDRGGGRGKGGVGGGEGNPATCDETSGDKRKPGKRTTRPCLRRASVTGAGFMSRTHDRARTRRLGPLGPGGGRRSVVPLNIHFYFLFYYRRPLPP